MKISKNSISENDLTITFLHDIEEIIETEDGAIVLLKFWVKSGMGYNIWNNVYKINKSLEIQWQIQGAKQKCYTSIVHNNDEYRAVDWDGFSNVIDMKTGKVVREYFVK
ncbi:hypothetical protein [Bdellovibrio sp. GT3]|uniref:hypothetical protein n=1 Tax=Bdellovibrio sp. GT3 TaxID=3136282 RepID=UPI0030F0117E